MFKRKEIIGDCTLYLGDNKDLIDQIECDAVVTDPPYGIGESDKKVRNRHNPNRVNNKWKKPILKDYGDFKWDSKPANIEAILLLNKPTIIFGGNFFNVPPSSCWLIWYKDSPTSHFSDAEMAWTNLKKAVRHFTWLWCGFQKKRPEERYHPTQKPIEVMKWCISHLPKDCQTIFDPFMGSGTTLVACAKMGRKGIGIEIDESYFDIACKRVEDAYKQPDMFGY